MAERDPDGALPSPSHLLLANNGADNLHDVELRNPENGASATCAYSAVVREDEVRVNGPLVVADDENAIPGRFHCSLSFA